MHYAASKFLQAPHPAACPGDGHRTGAGPTAAGRTQAPPPPSTRPGPLLTPQVAAGTAGASARPDRQAAVRPPPLHAPQATRRQYRVSADVV